MTTMSIPNEKPWETEPDSAQWTNEGTGLECFAMRGPLGHWCGYVAIAPRMPFYGLDYSNDTAPDVTVHGGLTYADYGGNRVPKEFSEFWLFGFDCAHAGDLTPQYRRNGDTYRTLDYVREECNRLAQQIAEASK